MTVGSLFTILRRCRTSLSRVRARPAPTAPGTPTATCRETRRAASGLAQQSGRTWRFRGRRPPSHHTDSVAFHFTRIPDEAAVSPLLTAVQERLAGFHARPHWGKVVTTSPHSLAGRYERLPDFRALLRAFDPRGTFRNDFVERLVMRGE